MTRFLLIALLVMFVGRAIWRLFMGIVEGAAPPPRPGASRPLDKGETMVRDPVCGTFVVPSRALVRREKDGVRYFCSEKCRDAFQKG